MAKNSPRGKSGIILEIFRGFGGSGEIKKSLRVSV